MATWYSHGLTGSWEPRAGNNRSAADWLAGWQRRGWLAVGEPSGHCTEILVPES